MMLQKHKGTHSELVASAWLLTEGYEVFRNISPFGPIDLVAVKDGEVNFFDVKSNRASPLKAEQFKLGVRQLYVNDDGSCAINEEPNCATKLTMKQCPHCEWPFMPKRHVQIYCGKSCENGAITFPNGFN